MLYAIYVIYGLFVLLFLFAQVIKNNSIVDIFWGLGFVLTVWVLYFLNGEYTLTKTIINIMVSMWGLRLFYHIAKRNIGKGEDFRYKNWRRAWGRYVVPRAFLQVFMLQASFMFIIGSAANYVNLNSLEFNYFSIFGLVVFFIGYYYQVIGDYELKIFLSKNKGLMKTGLWGHTRHPNYFGESLIWFGIFIFAFINGAPWYLVISPITITLVLRFISIPLLEEKMSKKEGWEEYSKRVNIMFPWVKNESN